MNHHLHSVVISVFQRYKTDFSTSIGWYINIISCNESTVCNCTFKLKPKKLKCCYHILYGRILATSAAGFLTVYFRDFFLQRIFPQLAYAEMSCSKFIACFAAILFIVLYALALFPQTF